MRSYISKVAGWLVPARGTCSRKLSSPSASMRVTGTPSLASASDTQRPTGPAPMTMTRSDECVIDQPQPHPPMPEPPWAALGFRHHILGGAGPAVVGEVEHHAVGIAVLRLVERIRRGGPAREVGAARIHDLLFGRIEIVDPHAEMVEAELLVLMLLGEQG